MITECEAIKSRDNARLKAAKKIRDKSSERRKTGLFFAEGVKMTDEALAAGAVDTLILSESFFGKCTAPDRENAEGRLIAESGTNIVKALSDEGAFDKVNTTVLSDSLFNDLADTVNPQGAAALVKKPSWRVTDEAFLNEAFKRDGYIKLLITDGVQDPGNLGTMVRTAEAAGMTGIIMSRGTADIFNPKVVRSTMGSILRVPFFYVDDLGAAMEGLKALDIKIFSTHLKGKSYMNEVDYGNRCAVVIGNEARGISDTAADLCDVLVKIPMHGKVESLNASIAAAIMMYRL
ncbi:MAG: RNA methyltransferase [Catonella sp.]|nr:RNA methyltransferase [Catonella sp.]MDY6357777.1 RNA methyltransferase [Catonella sp.]